MRFTTTLKKNYEFARAYHKGKYAVSRYVVVHYLKKKTPGNRLGVSCTRKVRGSVRRNRRKRLLREGYRLLEPQMEQGYDIVLIARDWREDPGCAAVTADIAQTMRRVGIIRNRAEGAKNDQGHNRNTQQNTPGGHPVL